MGFENYFQSSAYFFHVWAADFKKIALQKKAALTTHCTLYDAREIICCRTLIHAVLVFVFVFVFPGISAMDLLADFSLVRSRVIIVCCGMWGSKPRISTIFEA